MSAAELRQAANTLRGWAEKATSGPWEARLGGDHAWVALYDDEEKIPEGESLPSFEQGGSATSYDAAYIATMHPGVGLALAAWLDDEARAVAAYHANKANPFALDLARLINGSAS